MSNTTTTWPMLKNGNLWLLNTVFNNEDTRKNITEIHFVTDLDEAEKTNGIAVDVDGTGLIKAYINGSVIKICSEGAGGMRLNPSISAMFAYMSNLTTITGLELLDASEVTAAGGLFYNCSSLTEIDLSLWNMDRITNGGGMFCNCTALTSVKLAASGIYFPLEARTVDSDTNAEVITHMFDGCSNLTHVDLGRGVTHIPANMFKGFTKLKTVAGLEQVITIGASAFEDCCLIERLDFGHLMTVIPTKAFSKCLKLKTVTGLDCVTEIGARAFVYTAELEELDINMSSLTSIGESAFYLSCIEDYLNFSEAPETCTIGAKATRKKRWNETALDALENYPFPENEIFLQVPNSENQQKYTDILFGTIGGTSVSVAEGGCSAAAWYHEWQSAYNGITSNDENTIKKQYDCFGDWWNATIGKTNFVTTNTMSGALAVKLNDQLSNLIGAEISSDNSREYVSSVEQLNTIIERLQDGKATFIEINSANHPKPTITHDVLVIGCTPDRKLLILDSKLTNPAGDIVSVHFEDLFIEAGSGSEPGDYDYIYTHEFPTA